MRNILLAYLLLLVAAALIPLPVFDTAVHLGVGIPLFIYTALLLVLLMTARSQEELKAKNRPDLVYLISIGVLFWFPILVMWDAVANLPLGDSLYLHRLVFGTVLFLLSLGTGAWFLPNIKESKNFLVALFVISIPLSYLIFLFAKPVITSI